MRLSRVRIQNFKAIDDIRLIVPQTAQERIGSADFLSLIGENNCAKSSVLEALRLAMPGTDVPKPELNHFPNRDVQNGPIIVELEFVGLTDADKEEQGIRTHIYDEKYRIKKVWDGVGVSAEIFAFQPDIRIPTWPDPDNTMDAFRNAGEHWPELLEQYEIENGSLPKRVGVDFRKALKEFAIAVNSPLIQNTQPDWVKNPGGFSSHVDSVLPKVIFVPAIREIKNEAEVTQKKSAARQIVEAMFSSELAGHPAIESFTQAGDAVKTLFSGGEGCEIIKGVQDRISSKLKRLINVEAVLDFTPPDIQADLASKTDLELIHNTIRTRPEHQGHGTQRALILSLLELLAEDAVREAREGVGFSREILLLIEEPEIYLHPQMCRRMRDVLLSIARSGTAQVICTTHSPIFIDLADRHDGIVIMKNSDAGIIATQRTGDVFVGGTADEDRKRLRMLLDFDSSVNEVFFSRKVCLVEGDCEVAALEATAKNLENFAGIDFEKYLYHRRNIVLVNCKGKWTITSFQRVLNGFEIPYRVVHDKDGEGDAGANQKILELLGNDEKRRLVHAPNFEQQIFNEAWSNDKPWKATKKILEMETMSDDLKTFFEFVLEKKVQDLV